MQRINEIMAKIVTHAGNAHLDEFLSVAVLIATGEITMIYRREPTAEDMADPNVYVVDVGGQYDPSKRNYDHHQFSRGTEAECALSLLARDLTWRGESVFEALENTKWFQILRVMDAKGPVALARKIGTTPEVVHRLMSPVQGALVGLFSRSHEVAPGDFMWGILQVVGAEVLYYAVGRLKRVKSLDNATKIVEVNGVKGFILESADTDGVGMWRVRQECPLEFNIVYDNRGPGWSLYRYDDCPRIDFTRVKSNERVTFTHAGGHIAKTASRATVTLEDAIELVRASIVG
jgi:hypothetical protein